MAPLKHSTTTTTTTNDNKLKSHNNHHHHHHHHNYNQNQHRSQTTSDNNKSRRLQNDKHKYLHYLTPSTSSSSQFKQHEIPTISAGQQHQQNKQRRHQMEATINILPSSQQQLLSGGQLDAVIIRGLTYQVGRTARNRKVILNGINLTVPEGSIYGLLGPSGCGKTTMLKCIVGRIRPKSGSVLVFGLQPGEGVGEVPGRDVGYMPQDISIYEDFTIEETLHYFGKINQLTGSEIKRRIEFLLQFLDLPSKKRLVINLSGGQKRRVSLAAALVHSPPLLILDEPTVGVDPLLRQNIWRHLVAMTKQEKISVIITTHYIEEARLANVVGLMRNGRILAEASPDDLMHEHQLSNLEDVFLKLCVSDSTSLRASARRRQQNSRQNVVNFKPSQQLEESNHENKRTIALSTSTSRKRQNKSSGGSVVVLRSSPTVAQNNSKQVRIHTGTNRIEHHHHHHHHHNNKNSTNKQLAYTNEVVEIFSSEEDNLDENHHPKTKSSRELTYINGDDDDDDSLHMTLSEQEDDERQKLELMGASVAVASSSRGSGRRRRQQSPKGKAKKYTSDNLQHSSLISQDQDSSISREDQQQQQQTSLTDTNSMSLEDENSRGEDHLNSNDNSLMTEQAYETEQEYLAMQQMHWSARRANVHNLARMQSSMRDRLGPYNGLDGQSHHRLSSSPIRRAHGAERLTGASSSFGYKSISGGGGGHSYSSSISGKSGTKSGSVLQWCEVLMAVTWKNYIRLRRNPPVLVFQFMLPAIQVILFCLCIGGEPFDVPVAIVNEEQVPKSSLTFLTGLDRKIIRQIKYDNLTSAMEAVRLGHVWGALHIPDKYSENLQSRLILGEEVTNETISNGTIRVYPDLTNLHLAMALENTFRETFIRFARDSIEEMGYDRSLADLPIQIGKPIYGTMQKGGYLEFMAPGVVISISYVMATGLTALAFILERRDGLLERSLVSGVQTSQILLAHAINQVFVMIIQIFMVLGCTFFIFEIPSRGPFFWVVLLILLQGCTGMGFGLLVSAICAEENTAVMMVVGTFYTNLILAGIIWPIEAMPHWLRPVSWAQPQTLPTESLRHILSRGWGISEMGVLIGFAVTIGWLVVFLMAAGIIFKYSR